MKFQKIIVDTKEEWIEQKEEGYVVFVGEDVSLGDSEKEVINQLRSKGYIVKTEPIDDGLMDIWRIFARNRSSQSGEQVWPILKERDIEPTLNRHIRENPDSIGWRTDHLRIDQESFKIMNGGVYIRRNF